MNIATFAGRRLECHDAMIHFDSCLVTLCRVVIHALLGPPGLRSILVPVTCCNVLIRAYTCLSIHECHMMKPKSPPCHCIS